jgi:hypothetical protein
MVAGLQHARRPGVVTFRQRTGADCSKHPGHNWVDPTLVYARTHDKTVEADYFAAMGRIEQRLELVGQPAETPEMVSESERGQLMALAEQLFTPELSFEMRLEIAVQLRALLEGDVTRVDWIPPPVLVFANAEVD